jgi:hypothetical protein
VIGLKMEGKSHKVLLNKTLNCKRMWLWSLAD